MQTCTHTCDLRGAPSRHVRQVPPGAEDAHEAQEREKRRYAGRPTQQVSDDCEQGHPKHVTSVQPMYGKRGHQPAKPSGSSDVSRTMSRSSII
jgi:hypothetical protein